MYLCSVHSTGQLPVCVCVCGLYLTAADSLSVCVPGQLTVYMFVCLSVYCRSAGGGADRGRADASGARCDAGPAAAEDSRPLRGTARPPTPLHRLETRLGETRVV